MRTVTIIVLMAIAVTACGQRSPVGGGDAPPSEEDATGDPRPEMAAMAGMSMEDDGVIRVSPRQAALAGVTFAVAREAPVERTVRSVAMAVPNERGLGIVNARVSGWVERLHANETGRFVRSGEALFDLYAPELVAAQEELLLARRLTSAPGGDSMVAAARRRLTLWGIAGQDIARLEARGTVEERVTIRSPYRGHVLEKAVIEGQMIHAGDRLFEIADLSSIWIESAVFENDISLISTGQRAEVTFNALPGRVFEGHVTFIHPRLDRQTRTLRIRIEIPNPDLDIKPMMYGTVRIHAAAPRGVTVPLTAILPTGPRDLAFVVRGGGVVPAEVVVGTRGDSTVLVADGLSVGDTVIASATFLFDSEAQLAEAMAGIMLNMGMGLDMGGMQMDGMGEMNMSAPDSQPPARDSMPGMNMNPAGGQDEGRGRP